MARKRELSAAAAVKRLEILYATRLARVDKLSSRLLLTQQGPRLYWCPAMPSKETEALAEAQRAAHAAWKAGQMEQLEAEKAALYAQLTQPRRQPRGEGGQNGEAQHGSGGEGEEGEEEMGDAVAQEGGSTEQTEQRDTSMDAGAEGQQEMQEEGAEEPEALEAQLQPPLLEGEDGEPSGGGAAAGADA